ncbi:MAG: ribonuclease HII [Mycoplasmoidaceae bacterium]
MKTKKQVDMFLYEHKYQKLGHKLIAGVDEVGRGCWAGPVVACACILPVGYENKAIKDSKVLSIKKREELAEVIKQNCIAYAIAYVDAPRIDLINIKEAAREAMVKALNNLHIKPTCVLVDAEDITFGKTKIVPIIKGDAKSTSIAAASIIAKVYRDKILDDLDKIHPQYGFAKNKGYGTNVHLNALKHYGPIKAIHRFSYKPVKAVIKNN